MNTHLDLGLAMIAQVLSNVIQDHHERLDGLGYPYVLRGEQISLQGRIVAVADVFDALTSRRPYRHGCSVAEGLALVQEQAAAG
jgi:putative two-component system response regulator